MNAVLFGLIMLGVGWLAIWCCFDHSKQSTIWWPFDIRSTKLATSADDESSTTR